MISNFLVISIWFDSEFGLEFGKNFLMKMMEYMRKNQKRHQEMMEIMEKMMMMMMMKMMEIMEIMEKPGQKWMISLNLKSLW